MRLSKPPSKSNSAEATVARFSSPQLASLLSDVARCTVFKLYICALRAQRDSATLMTQSVAVFGSEVAEPTKSRMSHAHNVYHYCVVFRCTQLSSDAANTKGISVPERSAGVAWVGRVETLGDVPLASWHPSMIRPDLPLDAVGKQHSQAA